MRPLLLAVLCLSWTQPAAQGTMATWTGMGGNVSWGAVGNWTGGPPASASTTDIVFAGSTNFGTAGMPLNQDIASAMLVNSLTFNSGGGAFFLGGSDFRFEGLTNAITQNSSSAISIANGITAPSANSSFVLALAGSGSGLVTISGAILTGNGHRDYSVVKSGSSAFALTGSNTYAGGTTINGGTLLINSVSSLGALSGGLTINAGTLEVTTGFSTSRGITLSNAASTLQIDPTQTYTITSAIGGTGTLNKTGSGTLTLSGTNTYTGGAVINGGTVVSNSGASLGNGGTATINAGTLEIAATYTAARNFTLGNAASTIMVDPTFTLTIGNVISGSGNLNKSGTGTLSLTGADTYSGGTYVTAGTLSLGAGASLASTLLNVSNGATFTGNSTATLPTTLAVTANGNVNFNAAARTIASLDGASTGLVTLNTTNLSVGSGTYAGIIQNGAGAGSLTKTGAGNLTLTGANTFSGATTVTGGSLTAAAEGGNALGTTSSITVNSGGTLQLGAPDQINNTASLTLAGGTFAKGNFSEGSANSAGMGALVIASAASHIDFGTGIVGALGFAAFTPNGNALAIDNWSGTPNTNGSASTDRLIFFSDQSANLGYFNFTGYYGATEFALGGGFYEVTPFSAVPEANPAIVVSIVAAVGASFAVKRQRVPRLLDSSGVARLLRRPRRRTKDESRGRAQVKKATVEARFVDVGIM